MKRVSLTLSVVSVVFVAVIAWFAYDYYNFYPLRRKQNRTYTFM